MADPHDAYMAAAKVRDDARKRLNEAERAMWDAERIWEDAEADVQRAFVAIASIEQSPQSAPNLELSDKTKAEIEEIDRNSRAAAMAAKDTWFD